MTASHPNRPDRNVGRDLAPPRSLTRRRSRGHPLRALPALALACLASAAAAAPPATTPIVTATAQAATPAHGHYEQVRSRLRWVSLRVGGRELRTPDAGSRLLLAKAAADRAGLADVGLDLRDVYGVISAETSWFARDGLGRNGVTSQGLAQLEPATARALGVRDANDPVEAVHAAATLLREAAQWSERRIAGLRLAGADHAARLREGVSVYYNLSAAGRERWDGLSPGNLPVETQLHIRNVRAGAQQADRLLAGDGRSALAALAAPPALLAPLAAPQRAAAAMAKATPAAVTRKTPQPIGTIEWSGSGSDVDGRRVGRHVVWSNGSVSREAGGRVRWSSQRGGGNG